jgi:hypothetical protein
MGKKVINFNQLPDELMKTLITIERQSGRTKAKTLRQAAEFHKRVAITLAPFKSGDTVQGIKIEKSGKNFKVISEVDNFFPHNVWADNKIVGGNKGGTVVPYPWVQETGVSGGGFFTKARKRTKRYFNNLVLNEIRNWETIE